MWSTAVVIPTRVLVFGMVREDGTIAADELYPVAEACGQSAEQLRSCLRRMVGERLLSREGTGRNAVYTPTARGLALIGASLERHRLAYGQDAAGRGWDRRWHLVAFAIPESRRAARDRLRDRLREFGGAAINPGLYASVHRWEKDVAGEADRLNVTAHVTFATTEDLAVGGVSDPRDLARMLWPVEELAEGYRRFVDQFSPVVPALEQLRAEHHRIDDAQFLPSALQMVTAFQETFAADPLLPPELLPRPWPGRAAREVLVKSRRLGLRVRQSHERPGLFRAFDDLIDSIP